MAADRLVRSTEQGEATNSPTRSAAKGHAQTLQSTTLGPRSIMHALGEMMK